MCPTSDGIECAEHFLLLCPFFDAKRRDFLGRFCDFLHPYRHSSLSNKVLTQFLLYGHESFLTTSMELNIFLQCIVKTGLFACVVSNSVVSV